MPASSVDFLVRLRTAGEPPRAPERLTPVRVVDPRYVVARGFNGARVRRFERRATLRKSALSWERDFPSRSKLRIRGREREPRSFRAGIN